MIQVSNLIHRYAGAQENALNGIDLDIAAGQAVGLLGPNGAGKTTLMSLLSGLLPVQQGAIVWDGVALERTDIRQRRRISLVPQDFAFYPMLTVWENMRFFASLYDVFDKGYLLDLLEQTGLAAHKDKLSKHLSGGLKRRLNFAIGLINRPEIVFLDEITVGIDPKSRRFILESVADLSQRGVTVIYTSHYLQEIEELCDSLVLLWQGKAAYQGCLKEIMKGGVSLERFYLDFLAQADKGTDECSGRQ